MAFLNLPPFPQPPIVALRHPVMLMHGFGAIGSINRPGMLHGISLHLRERGIWAYAPNVEPYQTIPKRAEKWKEAIDRIFEETGANRLHLVAHSMGGLDARYLISRLDAYREVISLTTVSTPHRGSSLATFMLNQPKRRRKWVTNLMNAMSQAAYNGAKPDALKALEELTPDYIQDEFVPNTPDHPDVSYFSFAGKAGKETDTYLHPSLVYANRQLFEMEGLNDGVVSVESARWNGFQGIIDADHARQVDLYLWKSEFEAPRFYFNIIKDIVANTESAVSSDSR